jgi:DNA (cytosine-5)-methyltransferase 1
MKKKKTKTSQKKRLIKAVDLFCGVGGLTCGLEASGIDVRLGVDIDPSCEHPFSANNNADYLMKSVGEISGADIKKAFAGADYSLLAGCAPCQPFSTYSQRHASQADERWHLLQHFTRLVKEARPDFVTMENVPKLAKQAIFDEFVSALTEAGYEVHYSIIKCADYGVPQQRKRLVLLASRFGEIEMIPPSISDKNYITVQDAIGELAPIKAGAVNSNDALHQASDLSPINMARMRASKPGGTWRDWDDELVASCHKKTSGKTYPGVYGRMVWDEPSPTITTQFYGFGNGRFGHPKQHRAISLREGAILQSFPNNYEFVENGQPVYRKILGRLIGNAVPVKLGEAIGKSFVQHIERVEREKERAA